MGWEKQRRREAGRLEVDVVCPRVTPRVAWGSGRRPEAAVEGARLRHPWPPLLLFPGFDSSSLDYQTSKQVFLETPTP